MESAMKSYLINLDRSQDRLEFMASEFERHGILFELVSAVDGRQLSDVERKSLASLSERWPAPLSPVEIGCFLSHRRCLERIATGEDEFAVIFEDDVRLSQGAARLLSTSDWIPDDADIVKIESHGAQVLISRTVKLEGPYSIARLLSRHLLSAGYIISRKAAQRLLPLMEKTPAPLDHFLFDPDDGPFSNMIVYQCSPAICRQAGLESTLGVRGKSKKRPTLFKLIGRELQRSIKRSKRNIVGAWTNITANGKWGPVPADTDII